MLDTVCATLLFPYTSHGACTIDSINHPQSDVVNFAFTKDEKKNTYIYKCHTDHKGIRLQIWGEYFALDILSAALPAPRFTFW